MAICCSCLLLGKCLVVFDISKTKSSEFGSSGLFVQCTLYGTRWIGSEYRCQHWCTVYPKKYAPGFCFAVLCCGYTLTDFPISIRLTSLALWQSIDYPVPAKQPWWIWINTSCEFIMNDCITTTKQSTTKPCAYFLGYTVGKYFVLDWWQVIT